jgi:hypothetical protein
MLYKIKSWLFDKKFKKNLFDPLLKKKEKKKKRGKTHF